MNLPSGATIVLVATLIFFLSVILSPKRRRIAS
jgi:ABC-type Mn2+/Zn2+ transport system permease subunit